MTIHHEVPAVIILEEAFAKARAKGEKDHAFNLLVSLSAFVPKRKVEALLETLV